jgi:rubrerythrin
MSQADEVKLCVEILDRAIAFEEEGMRFFQDRASNAAAALERRVFHSLAQDEAGHKAYLLRLKEDLLRTSDMESLQHDEHAHRGPREIFETALGSVDDPLNPESEELEILRGAMEVERRGYRLYSDAAERVESPRAKALFRHLAGEEQNHFQLLHNTYEYMSDPEVWHGYDESPMLDGG